MPEAIVKIKNKIMVIGKFKDLTATLKLPVTDYLIEQTLRELRAVGAGKHGRMQVEWLDSRLPLYRCGRENWMINHIYELNHLAERISTLDNIERAKLGAMCSRYLDEVTYMATGLPEYEPSIAHAINLTHNLRDIQVFEGVSDDLQLGRFCITSGRIDGFEDLSETGLEFAEYDKIGQAYRTRLDGRYSLGYFVFGLPPHDRMQNPYDGKSLLIEPEPDQEPNEVPGQNGRITMGGM